MKKIIILILIIFPLKVNAISASAYIVMDTDSNRVLEGNNINKESLIASISKIMSSMVVINNISDLEKNVLIDDNVLKSYGSGIYVEVGENIKIIELLYGLMLRSGNDAAIALAYNVGGSMEGFAKMMNELANSIGMNNTNFINSSGLEDGNNGNISTVYDMALLSSYAIKNNIYKKIVSTKNITVKTDKKTYVWHNKNRLLNEYKYCTGGKTGFTEKARRTLVTNASKDNINLTVVTFNDGNDFNDHKDLYEKYFNILKNYEIVKKGKIKTNIDNTYVNEDFNMSLTKDEYKNIKRTINYLDSNASKVVGNIEVSLNGKVYFKTDILVKDKSNVTKYNISFFKRLVLWVKSLW
jgi:serine-type D-Ala-D-Ala carboxypeptidase (penicillin-binding protein 5/6)